LKNNSFLLNKGVIINMRKAIFIGLILLLLTSFVFSYSAPTTLNQPILVESDSSFYGSSQGQVIIDLNLTLIDPSVKDFFVRITGLDDTNIIVREISFNKDKIETNSYHVSERSKTKLSLNKLEKKPMQIILEFDPQELGFGREFDIQLVTKEGLIIADLDPFISGWDYRQEWTLNTNGISLSGNITNDHVILFKKTDTDTDFWANVDSDGADVRFTNSNNDNYTFHFEDFNSTSDVMIAWVDINETFNSTTDVTGYIYYGNSGASDSQNEAGTYPASYLGVYHMEDATASKGDNGTSNNMSYVAGKIGTSGSFNGTTSYIQGTDYSNYDFGTSDFSIIGWVKSDNASGYRGLFSKLSCSGSCNGFKIDASDESNSGMITWEANSNSNYYSSPNYVDDAWHMLGAGRDGTTIGIIRDNASKDEATGKTLRNISNVGVWDIGGYHDTSPTEFFSGEIDELKLFNYYVSDDEIKLLYASENLGLVSFATEEILNASPDVNVTSPTINLNWNGTKSITFNVSDTDGADTHNLKLYYSTSAGGKTNLIYEDTDLDNGSGITCSDYDFTDSTSCTYSWDTTGASDGQYYIDAVIDDGTTTDTDSSPIFRVDNTKPVTTFAGCDGNWFNVNKTITLSCADTSGSGCDYIKYQLNGGSLTTYSSGITLSSDFNNTITYYSVDNATNQEVTKTSYCAIDKTSPSVASPVFVGFVIFGGFINGVGTILGGLATDLLSGIDEATCEYTLNGGGTWLSGVWNTDHCEKTSVSVVDGTDYNIGTRVDDNATNTGTSDFNGVYVGDTTAPSTTDDSSNSWSGANETITLSCDDGSGSGCLKSYYCVDEAGACTPTTIGTSVSVECSAGSLCSQYVRYFSQDNVDNNESVQDSLLTRIDKELPTTTSIAITDVTGRTEDTAPDLTISASDGSGSGLKEMSFSCDDSTWGSWITYNANYSAFDLRTGAGCSTDYGTKTIYVRVRDNVDNVSLSTSDTTLLDAPIVFSDLNLFLVGDYTQTADLTIDSDHNIEVQVKATSNDLNLETAKWFYQSPFNDANCSGYVRGNIVCGFQEEDEFNLLDLTGTTFTLRSDSEDDHAFIPYACNQDPDDYAVKSATSVTFNNSGDWAKVLISNVMVDRNTFYNMSWFGSYVGTNSRTLNIYDCNSDVADPVGNNNCFVTPFTSASVVDDDGYFSVKHISNDSNQIAGVNLNADGNHFIYYNCPSCSVPKYWELGLIDVNSNVDKIRNSISATGVANLVATEKTIDTHYHFIDIERNNTFSFYFEIDNNQGKTYTSTQYNELISLVNITPEITEFISPKAQLYDGNIDVNISVSDPESDTLVCDFNLVNTSLVHVGILAEDLSPVDSICHFDFNSLLYADANYLIQGVVRETTTSELFNDVDFSEEFQIFNNINSAPTITIVQPNGSEFFENAESPTTIIFTLKDTTDNNLFVNLNYSATTGIGSGTQLLLQEYVLTSSSVLCDSSDFSSDVNCSYSWDFSGVADGNYYINMLVGDGDINASDVSDGDFNIYTLPVIVSAVVYTERFVSADYGQRDENIYFNPTTAYFLTDDEKQNIYLEQVTLILLVIGVIIGLGVFILWKRKK